MYAKALFEKWNNLLQLYTYLKDGSRARQCISKNSYVDTKRKRKIICTVKTHCKVRYSQTRLDNTHKDL